LFRLSQLDKNQEASKNYAFKESTFLLHAASEKRRDWPVGILASQCLRNFRARAEV